MPTWPAALPASPLADRFRETPPDTLVRTEMDQGPAKVRRRTTAGVRMLSLGYLLSASQVAALDGFYLSDLAGGALAFSFTHPRTGAALSCRFKSPPSYAAANGAFFHAGVELEVLP